jgi:hypothetical protein
MLTSLRLARLLASDHCATEIHRPKSATELCRQQAKDIQNHEIEYVRCTWQSEVKHWKCRRLLKLGGCKSYGRSSDLSRSCIITYVRLTWYVLSSMDWHKTCILYTQKNVICIGAPIIFGRRPSLSAHESGSMLRTYLVCREKQANGTWEKHAVY